MVKKLFRGSLVALVLCCGLSNICVGMDTERNMPDEQEQLRCMQSMDDRAYMCSGRFVSPQNQTRQAQGWWHEDRRPSLSVEVNGKAHRECDRLRSLLELVHRNIDHMHAVKLQCFPEAATRITTYTTKAISEVEQFVCSHWSDVVMDLAHMDKEYVRSIGCNPTDQSRVETYKNAIERIDRQLADVYEKYSFAGCRLSEPHRYIWRLSITRLHYLKLLVLNSRAIILRVDHEQDVPDQHDEVAIDD